jgi:hypothetical protein
MLKMQTSNSKIKIADSIRAAVMERNTARSIEKLRKRLNAIREKAKNKSQFDKIIAKMEARFVGTNGTTKNTIVAPKSLAKAEQIVMSVEEGESCELPVADVTIKKGCKTDIIPCSSENTSPQKFSNSNIEKYAQGSSFSWTDNNGAHSITVDACDFIFPGNNNDLPNRLGLTFLMPAINPKHQKPPFYIPLSDKKVNVCLDVTDPNNPQWTFHFENIRIPIFCSTCSCPSYTEMGGNESDWTQTIQDSITYKKAYKAMKWWVSGSYLQSGPPPYNYTFKSIIQAHEDLHFADRSAAIEKIFNEAFKDIYNDRVNLKDAPCPDDAMQKVFTYNTFLNTAFGDAGTFVTRSELDTDIAAATPRGVILTQLERWAMKQSWYPKSI